jgi:alpha-tubulin suppressor-like RCC1 family protein
VRAAGLLLLVAAVSCGDPVVPRTGVVTHDDPGSDGFVAVSAGREHTCALRDDGRAFCWGGNEFGQAGPTDDGTRCARGDRRLPCLLTPQAAGGSLAYTAIAAGGSHTCGVAADRAAYCWGDNERGQLGDPGVRASAEPVRVGGTALFTAVAAGASHTCALRTDGVVLCWGANDQSQLGNGVQGTGSAVPVQTQTSQRFTALSASADRTCARATDGSAYCWGRLWVTTNSAGEEVTRAQAQPFRIPQSPQTRQLSVGTGTTCAVDVEGAAQCWESNRFGTFGSGSLGGSSVPQKVLSTVTFLSVSVGSNHACGVLADGKAVCWGLGSAGQLGYPPSLLARRCQSLICSLVPVPVTGRRLFERLSAGDGTHVCGVTTGRNIYCWGGGTMGQRGDGRRFNDWAPVKVVAPDP